MQVTCLNQLCNSCTGGMRHTQVCCAGAMHDTYHEVEETDLRLEHTGLGAIAQRADVDAGSCLGVALSEEPAMKVSTRHCFMTADPYLHGGQFLYAA